MTVPAHVLAAVRSIPHPSIPHPRQEPDMSALYPLEPHTEAEEARLKRIEGAEPAPESWHPSSPDQLMAHALGVCWHSPTSDRWPCGIGGRE